MDIHKPKPVRSWRELLTEVGVIVLSVCIALAGEQGVEWLHNRTRAAEARASVHAEIARNLTYMDEREKYESCLERRLDEVEELVAASAMGKKLPDTIWLGMPVGYLMQDGKYKSAVASGNASLFNEKEQAAYADLYAAFAIYWQTALDEQKTWASLRVLERHPTPSPALDWQLRNALQQARFNWYYIQIGRGVSLGDGMAIGVSPSKPGKGFYPTICLPLNTTRDDARKLLSAQGSHTDPP
jgi:hypothetical protein